MSFAMCGPDGGFLIVALLMLLVGGFACVAAVLAVAVYATIGLGKWAAARHLKRLAANER
jgi:hypothetical protein